MQQALVDTLGRRGARVGLIWLGTLAFFATFSPILATSHPLLMKSKGSITSPVLQTLSPADVMLLTTFVVIHLPAV